ncbi:ataxia telangiectasia mutated family protein [Apostasia shenzhenica]|uniref:Ataxia telangiectasia mutated family protein n=1 Tax=Apostasia shenzhenica TaxID=1088818 RepID=A0A2I0AS09_9ASPA|nr:ataxia telangiectasia mutated family protein [Apostasia shenzhenica]
MTHYWINLEKGGIAPIEDKLRESRLRWFGHINRRSIEAPVRKIELLDLAHVQKGRGRQKKKRQKTIRSDLSYLDLDKNFAQWKQKFHVADST